jgi:hypothetical protein
MSFRLAAYAVCVEDGRVLLARYVSPEGESNWTLPGGKVEQRTPPVENSSPYLPPDGIAMSGIRAQPGRRTSPVKTPPVPAGMEVRGC